MPGKMMVRTDMEGLCGVVNYAQVTLGTAEYAFGQNMFMRELLALIDGLRDGGIDDVVLFDEHATGRNTRMGELPDFVSSINGKPLYTADWVGGLDDSFDGMMMLGLHGKAGAVGGVLPHTYGLDILDIRVNGVSMGEIGIEAALAGDCGVPTLLIIADSVGAAEASALLPGVETVVTKIALGETSALCLSPSLVTRHIQEQAAKVVRRMTDIRPFVIPGPVQMEIVLADNAFRHRLRDVARAAFCSDDRLRLEAPNVTHAWTQYLQWDWLARQ